MRREGIAAVAAGVAVAALVVVAAVGGTGSAPRTLVDPAAFPAAMAPLPDGGLLYGERLTGAIRRIDPDGRLEPEPVATLRVSTEGEQRGLLGLAVDGGGRIFASWTDPLRRMVVGEVDHDPIRLIWRGPQSRTRSNGGRIAFAPDGSLVIGVGELLQAELVSDPAAPNGKLLRLDPDGDADQTPEVISAGWHNPFAFTFAPDGALWVADNSPAPDAERLARGDVGGRPSAISLLPPDTVPAGIAAVSNAELLVCGYLSRTLQPYRVGSDGRGSIAGLPLAYDCGIGVVRLADGRVVYANETEILDLGESSVIG